jgi:hypothetical protein
MLEKVSPPILRSLGNFILESLDAGPTCRSLSQRNEFWMVMAELIEN